MSDPHALSERFWKGGFVNARWHIKMICWLCIVGNMTLAGVTALRRSARAEIGLLPLGQ